MIKPPEARAGTRQLRPRRRTRLFIVLTLFVLAVSVLAGWSGFGHSRAAADTLVIGRASEITSLDPAQISIGQDIITQSALYDALVQPRPDYRGIVPRLATSVRYDAARRTYTFTIPGGLRFSDGRPLTSADVRFSIAWAKKGFFYGTMLKSISAVTTPNARTIVVKLSSPDSMVLPALSFAYIVPANLRGKKAADFFKNPVSSGPFKLESWRPGQQMQLVRNTAYRRPASLQSVTFRVITDSNARINAFRAGDIQLDEYVPNEQTNQIAKNALVEVNPSARLILIATNNAKPPFDDPKVREAASLALDRKALLASVWRSRGKPVTGIIPPGVPNSVGAPGGESAWAHNLARAQELLESSTHPGASLTLATSYDRGISQPVADAVQNQLTQAGFKVKLEVTDFASLINRLLSKDFEAGMLTNGAYLPTAGEALLTYAALYPPVAGWDAKQAGAYMAAFRAASTSAGRDAVVRRFESWVNRNYLAIPVGAPYVDLARSPSLKGLVVTPAATYSLENVRAT